MLIGAPVPLPLYTKETVPYKLGKNLRLPLSYSPLNPSYYKRTEALCQPPGPLALTLSFSF